MKKILALSFFLVTPLLGQDATGSSAHEVLENSDMSDGTTHWHGNAKAVGADSSTDLVSGQGGGGKGITVDLRPSSWAEVTQEIYGLKIHLSGRALALSTEQLTVVYQTSPDFSLSSKETDYADIGPNLGFEKIRIKGQPGQLMAFINYSTSQMLPTGRVMDSERITTAYINPKTDQQPQTFTSTLSFPNVMRTSGMTFCLAFPPGTGSVTLTKISLTELPLKPQQ